MHDSTGDVLAHPALGDRYSQRCMGSPVWEVSLLFHDNTGILHVQLREIKNRLDRKTLALNEFLRSSDFRKIGNGLKQANPAFTDQ